MKDVVKRIVAFRDERNWGQFHNLKDIAISITIESGELLELFQWKTSEQAVETKKDAIQEELADILIYALLLSHELDIDPEEIIKRKLIVNNDKYPVDKAYGTNKKYDEL